MNKAGISTWLMIILPCIGVLSFAASYTQSFPSTTQPAMAPQPPVAQWLQLDDVQSELVAKADPDFIDDSSALAEVLAQERQSMAELLEREQTTDDQFMSQVRRVIEVQNQLELRVADHLLKIRSQLTPDQRKRLMMWTACQVRAKGEFSRRYAHRYGRCRGEDCPNDDCPGPPPWSGQGQGNGNGRGGGNGGGGNGAGGGGGGNGGGWQGGRSG